jgi:hypothetical protein
MFEDPSKLIDEEYRNDGCYLAAIRNKPNGTIVKVEKLK